MEKFEIDMSSVKKIVDPDKSKISFEKNKHKFVKVAFDLFRMKDGNPEELWMVQSNEDGEFLVRTYSLPEEKQVEGDWDVVSDRKDENITVAYKKYPITKIAVNECDSYTLKRTLYGKLNSNDESFIKKLVASLPKEKQEALKEAGALEVKYFDNRLMELEKHLEKTAYEAPKDLKEKLIGDVKEILKDELEEVEEVIKN